MICLLKGTVHSITEDSICLLNSTGVGFEVFCNKKTLTTLNKNDSVTLLIHTHVSDDGVKLFGFLENRELNFFKILIKVNGVGCKMAQSILDLDVNALLNAISGNDIKCLTQVKGVGPKTAKRIVLELANLVKSKFEDVRLPDNENIADAKYALLTLGYTMEQIDSVFRDINTEGTSSDIIKEFLKSNSILKRISK